MQIGGPMWKAVRISIHKRNGNNDYMHKHEATNFLILNVYYIHISIKMKHSKEKNLLYSRKLSRINSEKK